MQGLRELAGFVRLNICLYTAALAAIGYLLLNRPDQTLSYIILSAFFVCAGAYSYNNITDIKEDRINRKKANYFAEKTSGKVIAASCFIAGFYFATKLSLASTIVYLSCAILGVVYSFLRIKRYFLIKNLWTAFSVSQSLLIGAFATSAAGGIVEEYVAIFSLLLVNSIIADMRDAEGDRKSGIATLPVKIGIGNTKIVVCALFASIGAWILIAGIKAFYILLPFFALSTALALKGMFKEAHASGGVSSFTLLAWLSLGGF